jgi:hypothetical protein
MHVSRARFLGDSTLLSEEPKNAGPFTGCQVRVISHLCSPIKQSPFFSQDIPFSLIVGYGHLATQIGLPKSVADRPRQIDFGVGKGGAICRHTQ